MIAQEYPKSLQPKSSQWSLYCINLTSKPDKDITREENHRPISLPQERHAKVLNKIDNMS